MPMPGPVYDFRSDNVGGAAPEILEFRLASRRPGDVYLSDIQESLKEMSRTQRVSLIKEQGNPRISVAVRVKDAEREWFATRIAADWQARHDAGSAASLIMFTYFVGGATAMWFIALPWPNKILTLALVGVATSTLVLALLPRLGRARTE